MGRGVTINGFHTLKDWGLHWQSCQISPPIPITSYIDVPGRKTKLDATESLYGTITFENRTLTFGFFYPCTWSQWLDLDSRIQTAISGRWCKVILDIEPDKYWMGRAEVSSQMDAENPSLSFFTITIDAEPFKYWMETPSGEDWLWDPFSFKDGVIQNLNNIQVDGTKTQAVVAKNRPATPTITATADMTVTVLSKSYELKANQPRILDDVVLYTGTTDFVFEGSGLVTISFRGETL